MQKHTGARYLNLLAAASLCLPVPLIAYGQSTEEIVVTARKREESLQEVPLSITAFSADQLQRLGATNNEDIALLTVNFNTVSQVGRRLDRPTIRGQSAAATGGEPNASYFVDGTFVSGSISTATLGPIERVEILRGPQSAQFGRATFAGAVNYVTRRPTNEFTGEVLAKSGTSDTQLLTGWVSGPVIQDKLLFFASAGVDKYGGEWNNNLIAGQAPALNFVVPPQGGDSSSLGGTDTRDFLGKLLWTPNDSAEVTLKLGFTQGEDDHYVQLLQEPGELNCYLPIYEPGMNDINDYPVWYKSSKGAFCGTIDGESAHYYNDNPFNPYNPSFDAGSYLPNSSNLINNLPVHGGPRQSRLNLPDFYNGMALPDFSPAFGTESDDWIATPERPGTVQEQRRALLQYDQDIGEWSMSTRAAFNKENREQGFDLDRSEQRYFGGVFTMFEEAQTKDSSFEIRFDSPADERLRGSVGLYYFVSDWESQQKRFVGQGSGRFGDPTTQEIQNKAVFGALEYSISDEWTISAEARYANDTKEIVSPIFCDDPLVTPEVESDQVRDKTDSDSLAPRITLRYEPTDNMMLYALVAKGNKPAEFNRAYFREATADPCESIKAIEEGATQIKEETAWTYETGGKATWMDGRLTTNLSLFYINWTNQSVFQTAIVGGNPATITKNAGKSEIYGLELETGLAVTENLTANFSYGLADGTFVEYDDPAYASTTGIGLDEDGELINGSNNVRGNRLPSAPKNSFITGLSYTGNMDVVLNDGPVNVGWFARTDFILETDRYTAADNFIKLENRKLWNARMGIDQPNWTVTAYVSNILDQQAPLSIFSFEYIQGLKWDNGLNGAGNPNGSEGTSVQAYSMVPAPGRNYGIELIYRFGN